MEKTTNDSRKCGKEIVVTRFQINLDKRRDLKNRFRVTKSLISAYNVCISAKKLIRK